MAYAQVNYQQQLGSSGLTIAQAGCFVTAFSNLLLDYNTDVDPATLDAFFQAHQDFTNGGEVTWSTVSKYDSNVTVTGIGTGWPQSNEAIVKFVYGNNITHFCKVSDYTQELILDSWDGKVKKSPYGNPVAFATYTQLSPEPTPPAYVAPVTEKLLTVTGVNGMNVRTAPRLNADIFEVLPTGTVVNYVAVVQGDTVAGNSTWLQSVQGHFYWSGNVNYTA